MNLVERVKAILLTPKTEWPVIEREPGDAAHLFANYVAILAAIPAVCGFVGGVVFGWSIVGAFTAALLKYVLTFVVVYLVALLVDALAPTFGGQKNFNNALKVTVYSYTPSWIAGVFLLIPGLRVLTILGLYGLYLLWLGLPVLMKAPQDRSIVYTIAILVCAFVLGFLISAVIGALVGIGAFL